MADDVLPVASFDSLAAYVEHVGKLKPGNGGGNWNENKWYGNVNTREAMVLATNGWPEGTRQASMLVSKLADRLVGDPGSSMGMALEYDVTGAAYDPGAVALGQPEAWLVPLPQQEKKTVRIGANICVSAGVPADRITSRGVAVAALAMALQARGYAVDVDVIAICGPILHTITVANASTGSIIDVDRLVYALAHPSMLRRLMFSATSDHQDANGGSWGRNGPSDTPEVTAKYHIYTGGAHMHQHERWADGGEAWILEEYKRQTEGT